MAAKYDFYKTPVSKDSTKRPRFHARIVSSGTIDTDDLAKRIHGRCTVTPADVAAVLISLSEVTAEYLREGKRVHIDGLGPGRTIHARDTFGVHPFQVRGFPSRGRAER